MISEKIKSLRQTHSLTQEEMSKILGCSVATVCGYENGKTEVSQDVINKYKEYFGCPTGYFFDDDIPLMETPELLETTPYSFKMKVIKDLARSTDGNNVCGEMNHPKLDRPYGRIVWLMSNKGEKTNVIILVGKTPREGERVAVITDDGESKLGYYYIDENHNVCIKSKPKGCKGIRNLKVDLNKNGKIFGIVEGTYSE